MNYIMKHIEALRATRLEVIKLRDQYDSIAMGVLALAQRSLDQDAEFFGIPEKTLVTAAAELADCYRQYRATRDRMMAEYVALGRVFHPDGDVPEYVLGSHAADRMEGIDVYFAGTALERRFS